MAGDRISTVDGDLINRCEIFDEADLEPRSRDSTSSSHRAAAGKRGKPSPTNAYGRTIAARDWDAIAQTLADDFYSDDRRRVVGAGIQTRSRCGDRELCGRPPNSGTQT